MFPLYLSLFHFVIADIVTSAGKYRVQSFLPFLLPPLFKVQPGEGESCVSLSSRRNGKMMFLIKGIKGNHDRSVLRCAKLTHPFPFSPLSALTLRWKYGAVFEVDKLTSHLSAHRGDIRLKGKRSGAERC